MVSINPIFLLCVRWVGDGREGKRCLCNEGYERCLCDGREGKRCLCNEGEGVKDVYVMRDMKDVYVMRDMKDVYVMGERVKDVYVMGDMKDVYVMGDMKDVYVMGERVKDVYVMRERGYLSRTSRPRNAFSPPHPPSLENRKRVFTSNT